MCGIFGYSGHQNNAAQIVLQGLQRLDYRGYDSWGIAALSNHQITIQKQTGKIQNVTLNSQLSTLNSHLAIGHTRWATHGPVTQTNAHPHHSTDQTFALAQNGIVENYQKLKTQLQKKGYQFNTDTDTEVIVRLIEDKLKSLSFPRRRESSSIPPNRSLKNAFRQAFLQLTGRNTILLLTNTGEILAARNGSPLVIGLNPTTHEYYLSSDTLSLAPLTSNILPLDNHQMIKISPPQDFRLSSRRTPGSSRYQESLPHGNESPTPDKKESKKASPLQLFNLPTNQQLPYTFQTLNLSTYPPFDKVGQGDLGLGKFPHYMIKEIHDSPTTITALLNQPTQPYHTLAQAITQANHIYTIGSGTAGVAAAQIAYYLRRIARVPTTSLIGSDANEYLNLLHSNDLLIAPSQSGETADVLEILELAHSKNLKIASLVNMPGSLITRLSDYPFMSQAGPEISVMSTKIFISQITWGYLLAKTIIGQATSARQNLLTLSQTLQTYLDNPQTHTQLKKLAQLLKNKKHIFLLGKQQNFQIAKEGMIKLIEGSYKHAHAIPAGDLKHYAITLMGKTLPIIAILSEDHAKPDLLNAISQIRARGATIIAISPEPSPSFDFHLPVPNTGETSALMNLIPLQLLSYYLAVTLGNDVDKPRNIAKSVTVK